MVGRWTPTCSLISMKLGRSLKRFLASSASFVASFLYSLLTVEMGRGYAEYLPITSDPGSDNERVENEE